MGVLTWALAARADPVALRGVERDDSVSLAVGTRGASVGARREPLDLAVDLGWDGLATGISAGVSGILAGSAWRVDGGVSGGIVAVPYGPTAGLAATPWIGAGWVGRGGALELRVASPMVAVPSGVGPVRLPLSTELVGGFRVDPVWIAPRVAFAPVWTPGLDLSYTVEAGLIVAVGLHRIHP